MFKTFTTAAVLFLSAEAVKLHLADAPIPADLPAAEAGETGPTTATDGSLPSMPNADADADHGDATTDGGNDTLPPMPAAGGDATTGGDGQWETTDGPPTDGPLTDGPPTDGPPTDGDMDGPPTHDCDTDHPTNTDGGNDTLPPMPAAGGDATTGGDDHATDYFLGHIDEQDFGTGGDGQWETTDGPPTHGGDNDWMHTTHGGDNDWMPNNYDEWDNAAANDGPTDGPTDGPNHDCDADHGDATGAEEWDNTYDQWDNTYDQWDDAATTHDGPTHDGPTHDGPTHGGAPDHQPATGADGQHPPMPPAGGDGQYPPMPPAGGEAGGHTHGGETCTDNHQGQEETH